jgi:hypothetical protein
VQAQTPDPSSQAPAGPAGQAQDGADAGGPRAVGTQQDANDAQVNQDPTAPMAVTPQEQAEFDQFISRFTLVLSDQGKNRPAHVPPGTPSPHDAILQSLNNPKVPLSVAIGTTTAQIAMMIVTQAKVNKVEYSPEVLFHACFECCGLVYLTGLASHIFKGCPPMQPMGQNGEYPFTADEVKLLCAAQMQAVRVFGTMELKAGMISPDIRQQNMDFWTQQVHREMSSGMVNEDVLSKLASSGLFAKKGGNTDPSGDGPQPAAAPTAPPQAGASPQPTAPPAAAPASAGLSAPPTGGQ